MPESLTLFDEPAAMPTPSEAQTESPSVEIRVSKRRKKWVAAHWEGDTVVVTVPARTSKRERQAHAEELAKRLVADRARSRPSDEELLRRAAELSELYLDGRAVPAAVNWSSRQLYRWGSCTGADRTVRVSDALRDVPSWVLDSVILHELAHLLHGDHGAGFQALIARYPRLAEADAYLAGLEHGLRRTGR